jgi:Mrp family chromosome partitioning ATPase
VASLALDWLFETEGKPPSGLVDGSILVTSGPNDNADRQRLALLLLTVATVRGELVLFMDAGVIDQIHAADVTLEQFLRGDRPVQSVTRRDAGRCVALVDNGLRIPALNKERKGDYAAKIMAEAARLFDLVVIDGGAVAENPQVAAIAATVDHVLVIARLSATSQKDMMETLQALTVMRRSAAGLFLVDPALRFG